MKKILKTRSKAQKFATRRNFNKFKMKGMLAQCSGFLQSNEFSLSEKATITAMTTTLQHILTSWEKETAKIK